MVVGARQAGMSISKIADLLRISQMAVSSGGKIQWEFLSKWSVDLIAMGLQEQNVLDGIVCAYLKYFCTLFIAVLILLPWSYYTKTQ